MNAVTTKSLPERMLTELQRQDEYIRDLPEDFQFSLFSGRQAVESQRKSGYKTTAHAARETVDNAIEAGASNVWIALERVTSGEREKFQRKDSYCEVVQFRVLGTVVIAELRLKEFPNLERWRTCEQLRRSFETMISSRGQPLDATTGTGHFVDNVPDDDWGLWCEEAVEGESWQSVVDRLAVMPSMNTALFYRVRGLFHAARGWPRAAYSEEMVQPIVKEQSLVFPLSRSRSVAIRLVFYRPESVSAGCLDATFKVAIDGEGFSGEPVRTFALQSRYDEISIKLVTRRVVDTTLAPISISAVQKDDTNMLVSEPVLLCAIRPPCWLVPVSLILFILAPLLAAISPQEMACIAKVWPDLPNWLPLDSHACDGDASSSAILRIVGSFIAALAGLAIFRRVPNPK